MPEQKVSEPQQGTLTSKYRLPETGQLVDHATYRQMTGKCETCGAQMDDHPKCDACANLCGTGHLDTFPSPYRGHNLCGRCIVSWKTLDRVIGKKATWDEFLNPKLKMFVYREN